MSAAEGPALRVVRGDATPEEVAALVAVLARVSGSAGPAAEPELASQWARPQPRCPLPSPGPGAWRAAARDARTRAAW
ncbi:MAG TPA: acyl-CoA carboxylase subunit epsilon [Frankiaceae bacterium]|nr:acyl-CoA carboxylase subunit epsilon [Frankiaceae bacterium]